MAIPRSSLPRFSQQASDWTPERIGKLERTEIEQLRSNAKNLGEEGVAALCDAALASMPKTRRAPAKVAPLRRKEAGKEQGNG
jgi:hypothetical protein